MATSYPAGTDTFVNPTGTDVTNVVDHAAQHTNANQAIEMVQSVMGTNGGTNIHKNFNAGDFPARINASNVFQQAVTGTVSAFSGTMISMFFGTNQYTGGTLASAVVSAPTVTGLADDTNGNVSASAHGFAPKFPNNTTTFLRGDGAYAAPTSVNTVYFAWPDTNLAFQQNAAIVYWGLVDGNPSTSEAIHQMNMPAGTFSEIRLRVATNGMTGSVTVRMRVNGSNLGPLGTITALTTGNFVGTGTVAVAAGDLVNLAFDSTTSSAGSSLAIQSLITKFSPI